MTVLQLRLRKDAALADNCFFDHTSVIPASYRATHHCCMWADLTGQSKNLQAETHAKEVYLAAHALEAEAQALQGPISAPSQEWQICTPSNFLVTAGNITTTGKYATERD